MERGNWVVLVKSSITGRGMASNTDLVTDLYAAILDRAPDPDGLMFWVQDLDGGTTLQQVRNGFAYSQETTQRLTILSAVANVNLPGAQIVAYENQLADGSSFAQVRTNFFSDRIASLYNDILGRPVDAAGLAGWQGLLAAGGSFQDVQNGIAYSEEATLRIHTLVTSQAIPLSGAEVVSYETHLAGGQTFAQMTADLDAHNIVPLQPSPGQYVPGPFVAPPLEAQTAPIGGSVQPFAALHIFEVGAGQDFQVNVSLGAYGTSGGLAPTGTVLSNPTIGTVNVYGNYSVFGTRVQVENALHNLTLRLNPNGNAVTLSAQIYGASIFPENLYPSITAATDSPASGLNFIYGTPGNDLLAGSAAADLFVLGSGETGFDIISAFDPASDILQLSLSAAANFADVQAKFSAEGPGTYIRLSTGSAVELLGVDKSSLRAENFSFV